MVANMFITSTINCFHAIYNFRLLLIAKKNIWQFLTIRNGGTSLLAVSLCINIVVICDDTDCSIGALRDATGRIRILQANTSLDNIFHYIYFLDFSAEFFFFFNLKQMLKPRLTQTECWYWSFTRIINLLKCWWVSNNS